MRIGVPKETAVNERRVALTPEVEDRVVKSGLTVLVERDAGAAASFGDDGYRAAGATVVATAAEMFGQSDVVLKVQPPSTDEVRLCRAGAALVAVFQPSAQREAVSELAARHVTAFSLALLPRITRAQPMDVLSSQATVAGYKAVLLAAAATGRFFPMLVTAAGTLPPARALVLGAGVAGLQAIATARRLGAVVSVFDVRPAVKEQVESLGAKFLELEIGESAETAGGYAKQLSDETHRRELAVIARHVKDAGIVITTAAIPGTRAPILITAEAVRGMKPGSVIVDRAAAGAGRLLVDAVRVRAGDLHRAGGDPPGLPAALHAAHVAHQRDLRHRRGRVDRRRRRRLSQGDPHPRRGRALRLHDEHRQRVPHYGPDAEDVQEAMTHGVAQFAAVLATVLFIFSLHWMNDPKTARHAVVAGVTAMLVAVLATWIQPEIVHHGWVVLAIVAGFIVGVPLSRVPLTAVPQRTALSHAFGGLAAGLVGVAEYYLWLGERSAQLTPNAWD